MLFANNIIKTLKSLCHTTDLFFKNPCKCVIDKYLHIKLEIIIKKLQTCKISRT